MAHHVPAHAVRRAIHALFVPAIVASTVLASSVACSVTDIVEGDDQAAFPALPGQGGGTGEPGEPNGCNLTGSWFVNLTTRNIAIANAVAIADNYFYVEIEDNGDDIVVTRSFDCGFEVCGATGVVLTTKQTSELSRRNRMDGHVDEANDLQVAPRTGTYKPAGDGQCELQMERWWSIRGANVANSLPARSDYSTTTLPSIQASKPLIPKNPPASPENDWDEDGKPGITLAITVPIGGWRAVSQRDWNEFGPDVIDDGATDFEIEAHFDSEEILHSASSSLLNQTSTPAANGHKVRFVYLKEDAPTTNRAAELAFCQRHIQELVHPNGVCTQHSN